MPRLLDEVLNAIRSDDPELETEGILLATSFFELSRGQTNGLYRADVLAEPASAEELGLLRESLKEFVLRSTSTPHVGTAVFALGKLNDANLVSFFVDVLRRYLHRDATVLYQAMIALDNAGVDVFAGCSSMSVQAVEENRKLASKFLSRTY